MMIREIKKEELSDCLDLIHKAFKTVADQFGFTKENCPGHNSFMPMEKLENFWNWGFKMYGLFEEDAGGMHFVNGGKNAVSKRSGHVGQFIHRDFRGREILRQSPWSVSVSVHPLRI